MEVYREVVEVSENDLKRVALVRTETEVANMMYVSYEVVVKEFEDWSGDYTRLDKEFYFTNVMDADGEYRRLVESL